MIVGEEMPHDAAGCANVAASVRPVAWYSPDGRTWQRSAPFEVGGMNARATAVWPIPKGGRLPSREPPSGRSASGSRSTGWPGTRSWSRWPLAM